MSCGRKSVSYWGYRFFFQSTLITHRACLQLGVSGMLPKIQFLFASGAIKNLWPDSFALADYWIIWFLLHSTPEAKLSRVGLAADGVTDACFRSCSFHIACLVDNTHLAFCAGLLGQQDDESHLCYKSCAHPPQSRNMGGVLGGVLNTHGTQSRSTALNKRYPQGTIKKTRKSRNFFKPRG